MNEIIGRFCFQIDPENNLIGRFSNRLHIRIYNETARRISGNDFTGEFDSRWTDDAGDGEAKLIIALKIGSDQIHTLVWLDNDREIFRGEGFIENDRLFGDYTN